jgi:cag pathogenicity island protein 24
MKYRRLTKEQFEELHKEFINFLATQSITAKEWKTIKAKQPNVAEEEMDIFSDLVWEGVLGKVEYLENIAPQHLYLFQVKENTIALIGLKIDIPSVDLTTREGFSWLREHLMDDEVELFNAEKEVEGDKNLNIFELIEKGARITKGELFKYFEQLIG